MKARACKLLGIGILLVSLPAFALTQSDRKIQPNDGEKYHSHKTGRLTDSLGELITIEGIQADFGKGVDTSLNVDTVNGVKLAEPRGVTIEGFRIPKNVRCVLKGYETGAMIGTPPAVIDAAKEQGLEPPGLSQAVYQWSTDFVVLIVVEPQALKLSPQSLKLSPQKSSGTKR
jgi:hypothetical protein